MTENIGVSRTRSKSVAPTERRKATMRSYNGQLTTWSEEMIVTDSYDDIMSDIVVPNYSSRMRSGEIINNGCSKTVTELKVISEGSYDYTRNGERWYYTGPAAEYRRTKVSKIGFFNGNPPIDINLLIDQAKARAIAAIDKPSFNFGEDLAELRSTVRFLGGNANSLYKLGKNVRGEAWKALKIKKKLGRENAAADIYNAYRFAAAPLYRSSLDAIEAYGGGQRDRLAKRSRLSARGYASTATEVNQDVVVGADTWSSKSTREADIRANILYIHSGGTGFQHHLGLRAKDIPVTAWNVVPLSFMVDRAFDISTAIKGMSNLSDPRTVILAASVSFKEKGDATMEWVNHVPSAGYHGAVSGITGWKEGQYKRAVWHPIYSDTAPRFVPQELVKDITNLSDLFNLGISIVAKSLNPLGRIPAVKKISYKSFKSF